MASARLFVTRLANSAICASSGLSRAPRTLNPARMAFALPSRTSFCTSARLRTYFIVASAAVSRW
ncbi:hypothetical protein AU375_05896 [Methylobacterium radiotolerans]|nr:hypothetical protein AU375_05896 [Methylobacterium radiotolerans]